ncbi:MAG: M48 family metallopeptidase [Gammaproteobacteria bacterium]|nr:M48 family metallopeptidase [Gammaproteobacteria bacterium]
MESNNAIDNFLVISTGSLVKDFDKSSVIESLCEHLSINKTVAEKILSPKVIIKKGLSAASANKYKKLFVGLGVQVAVVNNAAAPQEKLESGQNNIAAPETLKDFEALINKDIPKVKVAGKYKLGLLLAIIISTIAPLIYLGIIAGLIAGIVAYINNLPDILSEISGGTAKLATIIIPTFIPSILLLFLIKPLFARHPARREYILKRNQFPALFNLVDVMCNKIGVPVPVQISVNNDVNASASSMHGLLSLIRGQLKLTVGLPLITGMSLRQLTGVLAHEFGHFSQASAMTAYYLVNTINYWFYNRAYEPDTWDKRLETWFEKADWHFLITIAIMGAKLGIFLTRKLFAVLFVLNHKTTQFMSRHMEYDADSYESIFSGSVNFEKTAVQLRRLSYASNEIYAINSDSWNDNKLLKNLPSAIASMSDSFDDKINDHIKNDMNEAETSTWDSHPADNDRIANVLKRNDAGAITADYPAHLLCKDIDTLCEKVTLFTYSQYGIEKPENFITSNNTILNINKNKENASAALASFFNENFYGRCLTLEPVQDKKTLPVNLDATISALRVSMIEYSKDNEDYQKLTNKYSVMTMGQAYLSDGVDIDAADFKLQSKDLNQINSSLENIRERIIKLSNKLKLTDRMFFHRIQHDAQLMNKDQLSSLKSRLNTLKRIGAMSDKLDDLERYTNVLEALLSNDEDLLASVNKSINRYGEYCISEAKNILGISKLISYDKSDCDTLYDFALTWCNEPPSEHSTCNPDNTLEFSSQVLKAIRYHYYWVFADVCNLALTVESDNNIAPIKLV